jgi:hypothetical protein
MTVSCAPAAWDWTSAHAWVHTKGVKKQFQFLMLTGWLVPVGVALVYFGRWLTEIVVPTLKGGDFDRLYDLHGVRYLDVTLGCVVIAFAWVSMGVIRWARSQATTR